MWGSETASTQHMLGMDSYSIAIRSFSPLQLVHRFHFWGLCVESQSVSKAHTRLIRMIYSGPVISIFSFELFSPLYGLSSLNQICIPKLMRACHWTSFQGADMGLIKPSLACSEYRHPAGPVLYTVLQPSRLWAQLRGLAGSEYSNPSRSVVFFWNPVTKIFSVLDMLSS